MTIIPRNPKEWVACFADGTALLCAPVRARDPTSPPTTLYNGDFVAVRPSGTRRDDSFIRPDKEWIAQIRGLVLHRELGQIVELRWFLPCGDIQPAHGVSADPIIASLGQNEIIALAHHTYDFVDNIFRKVTIHELSFTEPSSRIYSPGTLFTRTELRLTRRRDVTGVQYTADVCHTVCKDDCMHRGYYHPDHDVLRYCELCRIFYHIECMDISPTDGPTLPPPLPTRPDDLPVQPDDIEGENRYSFGDYSMWQQWLRLPVQRGCGDELSSSFERIVLAIRHEDRARGCPKKPLHVFAEAAAGQLVYYSCPHDAASL
ncbi:hypothetical protein FKP32DRAFT_1679078 [Trametes sanguinea]|nr:hypothetical protein FKP32DRAFT_1679078 [Trametes sanguinea]